MGKKKFKKYDKKAEQQMESAERVSRLMEMYEAGEIDDEEFIELMNCSDAAEETVINNSINDIISTALGYDRSSARTIDEIKGTTTVGFEVDKRHNGIPPEMLYATEKETVDDRRSDIRDLEAKLLGSKMKEESKMVDSNTEKRVSNDVVRESAPEQPKPFIIPGITDYSFPEEMDPASMITNDESVFTPDKDTMSGPMPELVLVDTDDETVAIINSNVGVKVVMDLFGANSRRSLDATSCELTKTSEDFIRFIRYALLMVSGDCIIAPFDNGYMNSLISSVTSLDKSKYIISYVHYKESGIDPFYVMYNWTEQKDLELSQLMEWLEEENLVLEFASTLADLVTNSAMFPLLEEPRRSKYVIWSDDDEIEGFVNEINSGNNTEWGIVKSVDDFHKNCTVGALDNIIGNMYEIREFLSSLKEYELSGYPDERADAEAGPIAKYETPSATITVENCTKVETSTTVVEHETIEVDADIEVDDVEDTSSIPLTSNDRKTTDVNENSFVMKPIVK